MVWVMNINLEKVVILIVIGAFVVSSVNSLSALGGPITREEAIEISKNTAEVKHGLAKVGSCETGWFSVKAAYVNSSGSGHSTWRVEWEFGGYSGATAEFAVLIVVVDAETGAIIRVEPGGIFL